MLRHTRAAFVVVLLGLLVSLTPTVRTLSGGAFVPIARIDAGGSVAAAGWEPDRAYIGGEVVTVAEGGDSHLDVPYGTSREGTFRYALDVAEAGRYLVRTHFMEPLAERSGERVFEVLAEGAVVLPDLDIFDMVGAHRPDVRDFAVAVTDGRLDVVFEAVSGLPIVSAIEVFKITPTLTMPDSGAPLTRDPVTAQPGGGAPDTTSVPTTAPDPTTTAPPATTQPAPPTSAAPPTQPTAPPATTVPPTPPPQPAPAGGRPLLIKHGWDMPRPWWIRQNVAAMEQLGFDGVITTIDALGGRINSQTPVSYEEIRAALAPLTQTTFTTMTHNFLIIYTGDYKVFDDNTVPLANFRNLARAAREAGLVGIAFDNESYDGPRWKHPEQAPGRTLAEAQAQSQLRGRQAMAAMIEEWPDVTVLAFFGPWVSDPRTAAHFAGHIAYNDIAWANQLMGPFVVGMVEATLGTPATVVDGGEIYTIRSAAQYDRAYHWLKSGMVAGSPFVPAPLASAYPGAISVGFAVYDRPWIGVGMDVTAWRDTLTAALRRTDRYVWAYTESYDWWGTGWPTARVPQAWVDATRAAVSAATG